MTDYFKSIRPFNDDEVPKALLQIKDTPLIQAMMAYAFPEDTPAQREKRLLACQKVSDFQVDIMYQVVTKAIEKSITEFTYDGFSALDPKKAYVFVSNHRDIILDTSLLNVALHDNHLSMTASAMGDNLLKKKYPAFKFGNGSKVNLCAVRFIDFFGGGGAHAEIGVHPGAVIVRAGALPCFLDIRLVNHHDAIAK